MGLVLIITRTFCYEDSKEKGHVMKRLIIVIISIFAITAMITSSGFSGEKKETVKEIEKDGHFIAYDNGTVKDTKTGLIWAAKGNGKDINWKDAKAYCENYRAGGYDDWRMPTIEELQGLYDENKGYRVDCHKTANVRLTQLIQLSCFFVWAAKIKEDGSRALLISFRNGREYWHPPVLGMDRRVLPVRDN